MNYLLEIGHCGVEETGTMQAFYIAGILCHNMQAFFDIITPSHYSAHISLFQNVNRNANLYFLGFEEQETFSYDTFYLLLNLN